MEFTDDDIQIEKRIGELIDRGLEHYGSGDMEGALAQWKHALALDPENERAANYLEYVEEHHDLASEPEVSLQKSTVELEYPFGVSDLGLAKLTEEELEDYESFEILDSAVTQPRARAEIQPADSVDDGWNVDEGWVQELVAKSEAAFTPVPPEENSHESDIATLDLSFGDTESDDDETESIGGSANDDEGATSIHRANEKVRSLAGFDEFELDGPDDEEEEEPTRALLDSRPITGPSGATHFSDDTELELDEDEESTSFHDSKNRVGVAHAANGADFSDLSLDGLDDLGLGRSGDDALPLPSQSSESSRSEEPSSPPLAFGDGGSLFELELPDSEPGDDEQTMQLDLGSRGRDTMDLEATRQHFAIDDEQTIDRSMLVRPPTKPRAPTQDHGISPSSIQVDETLLSLQESTRELDLGDMGLALGGQVPELGSDEEYEVEISVPEAVPTPVPMSVPTIGPVTPPGSFADASQPTEAVDGGIMAMITRDAPTGDSGERILYIVNRLIEHAGDEFTEGKSAEAASAVCQALDYATDSAVAQKLIFENERGLVQMLISSLGDASQIPQLMCPLTEIPPEHIDNRAAFLLTRLDQAMTLDELLDVSGMPRLEALRHLCGLHVLNYLEVV